MEIKSISVSNKSNGELLTHIFEDEEGIKQITSDECDVVINLKDPHECEPNV